MTHEDKGSYQQSSLLHAFKLNLKFKTNDLHVKTFFLEIDRNCHISDWNFVVFSIEIFHK